MRNTTRFFFIILVSIIASCKKDTKTTTSPPTSNPDNYSSLNQFFSQNAPVMQTYTINSSIGGSFTSPQGTTVTIPANAFLTQLTAPVTGNIIIQFKDIYKKSDMFFSGMLPESAFNGPPLKSGGEFFIKAVQNNSALILASGKKITVSQPTILTGGIDAINQQQAFIAKDTMLGQCPGICPGTLSWFPTQSDSVVTFSNDYIFSMYQFNAPVDSGSWCNSDNSSFFSAYPQTILTLKGQDSVSVYHTEVFLLFKNLSSMVHVYNIYENFPYYYAPLGLQCTVVAIGLKSGQLYSSFVPITIGANQTVPFTLSPTTTSTFTTQLQSLN